MPESEKRPKIETKESKKIKEKTLTEEAQEKYPEEFREITEVASVAFSKVKIEDIAAVVDAWVRKPDTLFFSRNPFEYYCRARKFLSPEMIEMIHQGLRVRLLEMKQEFELPELKTSQKLAELNDEREAWETKKKTKDEEKILEKTSTIIKLEKKIYKLNMKLTEHKEKTLSEPKIKEQAAKYATLNLLLYGEKNSDIIKIGELINSKEGISVDDYDKRLDELASPILQVFHLEFPRVGKKTETKFRRELLKTAEQIGKEYLKQEKEQEKKEKKHDYGIYG